MDKVTFIEVKNAITDEITSHAVIDRGNGEFTTMPKAHYDELEAAKELKADEAKTK